jgi:hypothetical protein
MVMTVYAEQILMNAKCNQWFLLLHKNHEQYTDQIEQQHMNWFNSHLLQVQSVAAVGESTPQGNLYHVPFDGAQDPRLASYMTQFENPDGTSLMPHLYQMLEWSYEGWLESDGATEFDQWIKDSVAS